MIWVAVALAICFSGLWSSGHVPPEAEETVSSLATASASNASNAVSVTGSSHHTTEKHVLNPSNSLAGISSSRSDGPTPHPSGGTGNSSGSSVHMSASTNIATATVTVEEVVTEKAGTTKVVTTTVVIFEINHPPKDTNTTREYNVKLPWLGHPCTSFGGARNVIPSIPTFKSSAEAKVKPRAILLWSFVLVATSTAFSRGSKSRRSSETDAGMTQASSGDPARSRASSMSSLFRRRKKRGRSSKGNENNSSADEARRLQQPGWEQRTLVISGLYHGTGILASVHREQAPTPETKAEVRALLQPYGEIAALTFHSQNRCFVEWADRRAADALVALRRKPRYKGREIAVARYTEWIAGVEPAAGEQPRRKRSKKKKRETREQGEEAEQDIGQGEDGQDEEQDELEREIGEVLVGAATAASSYLPKTKKKPRFVRPGSDAEHRDTFAAKLARKKNARRLRKARQRQENKKPQQQQEAGQRYPQKLLPRGSKYNQGNPVDSSPSWTSSSSSPPPTKNPLCSTSSSEEETRGRTLQTASVVRFTRLAML